MFIVALDGKTVRNFSEINTFWLDKSEIKISQNNGCQCVIGVYDTEQEATEMFVALCRAIERGDRLFRMHKTGNSEEKIPYEAIVLNLERSLEEAERQIRKLQKENAELAEQKSNLERNLNMAFTANILREKNSSSNSCARREYVILP